MLVYLQNKFIQLLEGDKERVMQTYQRIVQDSRHHHITKLLEGVVEQPIFNGWSMGFKSLGLHEFEKLTGYRDLSSFFMDDHINNHSHPALIFLKLFYDKNYRDFERDIA